MEALKTLTTSNQHAFIEHFVQAWKKSGNSRPVVRCAVHISPPPLILLRAAQHSQHLQSCSQHKSWKTHSRTDVENEGGMSPEEHVVEPRHGLLVLEVVGEPRQHPRHAVVRFHLRIHGVERGAGGGRSISTRAKRGETSKA